MKPLAQRFPALRTAAAALLLVACSHQAPANPPEPAGDATAQAIPERVSEQIADLAERGKFEELNNVITALPDSEQTQALAESIRQYREHLQSRREAKREAYDKAMDEAMTALDEGKVEDAMVKVIEAHSLAEQPDKLLNNERVAGLIQTVADKAKDAKQRADFVDAVSLYRLLDLLYEESREYHDEYLDASTHVRVLQMYNPKLLRELYKQRAERLGNEEELELFAENDDLEIDKWQTKLARIDTSMLGQVITIAARRHVDKEGYTQLVRGAAEGLSIMIQTEGIEQEFPGLADEGKRQAMQDKLEEILADLDRPGRRLTRATAMPILADIMQTNLRTVELPENVIVYELASGATDTLDQFSSVVWPDALERQFKRSIQGKFVGIGVQIQKTDGKLTVVTPLEGTPAMKAGLKAEDIIAKVNGTPTGTWSVDKAVREITGPEDTEVTLTIIREGQPTFDVTLTRKEVKIESIKGFEHRDEGGWDYWLDQDAGIGYIRMTQFLRQTTDDLDAAVEQMRDEGELNAIVLDLRFNPGGYLDVAIDIVDRFVDRGTIVSTVNAEGQQNESYSASPRPTYDDKPELVILINQGSASASEIVSGALQDYERATVVGENSYGKGSVQDVIPIGRGRSIFKCTTRYYQLPKGEIIHRTDDSKQWGIQPDLTVKMTNKEVADWLEARRDADILIAEEDRDPDDPQTQPEDILADGLDPQLEAALLLLRAKQLSGDVELARKGE